MSDHYKAHMSEKDDLALLLAMAQQAGKIACSYVGNLKKIYYKVGNSPVTEADYHVDQFLRDNLLKQRPHYGWISEESVDTRDGADQLDPDFYFVIDPIDGTRGFIEQSPYWCISLAVVNRDGQTETAVLYCPVLQKLYHAQKGNGAYENSAALSKIPHDTQSKKLHISCSQRMLGSLPQYLQDKVILDVTIPSIAYKIALVAHGYFDAVLIRPKCNDWDLASADLILSENNGIICGINKDKIHYLNNELPHGFLIATRHAVLDEVIAWVKQTGWVDYKGE